MASSGGKVVDVVSGEGNVVEFLERDVVIFGVLVNIAGTSVRAFPAALLKELRPLAEDNTVVAVHDGFPKRTVADVATASWKMRDAVRQQFPLLKS